MSSDSSRYGALNTQIGTEIRRRRHERGLSTRDVEAATGIANNTVSKLENGEQNITPKYLEAFAALYDCEPRDLLPDRPEWRRLREAVKGQNAVGIVAALADLGIILSQAPTDPERAKAVPADVAALAAGQIRASADSMEAAIVGLRHVAQALDPDGEAS